MVLCFKMSPSISMFTIFYIKGEYVLMIPTACIFPYIQEMYVITKSNMYNTCKYLTTASPPPALFLS